MTLQPIQKKLIEVMLENEVLTFGSFKTKSGRISPYFFNTGRLGSGAALSILAKACSETLNKNTPQGYDRLFGPAYKGIPIAAAIACHEFNVNNIDPKVGYNRKEQKKHGEGGQIVGAPFQNDERLVLTEDVLTGGTALRQSFEMLKEYPIKIVCALVLIDREEKGLKTNLSAREELEKEYNCPVISVLSLSDIIEYLSEGEVLGKRWITPKIAEEIQRYQKEYAASK